MNARSQLIFKRALEAFQKVGSIGLTKIDALDMAALAAGYLPEAERDALWERLTSERYIIGHWEPLLRVERWALTERGATALAGL